jgi:hypothetical protein
MWGAQPRKFCVGDTEDFLEEDMFFRLSYDFIFRILLRTTYRYQ